MGVFLKDSLAALGTGLMSLLVERVAFTPLRRGGAEPMLGLITSLGAGMVLVALLHILMGAEGYDFPQGADGLAELPAGLSIGGAQIRTIQLLLLLSAAAVLTLTLWLESSRQGQALRAGAEDATAAQLLRINSEAMLRLAFFISGTLAGLGGGLIGVSLSLPGPYFGIGYGLKGLALLVLSGLGSVPVAIDGGLLMGLAEAVVPSEASGWRGALPFAGGAIGIFSIRQPFSEAGDCLLMALLLALAGSLCQRREAMPLGRAMTAIRDDELAAACMGIDTTRVKLSAFVLSAVVAGSSGALAAHFLNTWNARQGSFDVSVTTLAFVILGGSRTWLGPVLGGLLLTALPELLRPVGAGEPARGAAAGQPQQQPRWPARQPSPSAGRTPAPGNRLATARGAGVDAARRA